MNMNCDLVFDGGHNIKINLKDKTGTEVEVYIEGESLLKSGLLFGDTNDTCYITVFSNPNGPQD